MYRLLKRLPPLFQTRKLSTTIKVDPTLLAKFKCHPTIPCGIPMTQKDLNEVWYHIPDDLLPINWSTNWHDSHCHGFMPGCWCCAYNMGKTDIFLIAFYGIPYPIKGVMYCIVERIEPGGLFDKKSEPFCTSAEGVVFQDANGDYYFFYEFSQGGDEYLAKFRAPRGTTVSDFVKHHFRGAVKGVDMDLVLPDEGKRTYHDILQKEQKDLARLHQQARAESRCACFTKAFGMDMI